MSHNYYAISKSEVENATELLKRFKELQEQYEAIYKKLPGYANPHLHNEMSYHSAETGRQIIQVICWLEDFIKEAKNVSKV